MPLRDWRHPAVQLAPGEWLRWQINYRFGGCTNWTYRLEHSMSLRAPLACTRRDGGVAGVGPTWMYRGNDHSADLGFLLWLALKRAFF